MINGQAVKNIVESVGIAETGRRLRKMLKEGKVKANEFSLRELAESLVGADWVRRLNPANMDRFGSDILEAGEGVDVSAFSNITGQLIFSQIHQGWDAVPRLGDDCYTTIPTNLDGEKIPGIGRIGGDGERVHPGQDYPVLGFGEDFRETPSTTRHGLIVEVTKETIFFDRTSLVLKRAGDVGERLAYNKEKRQLAGIAGVTVNLGGGESFDGNNHNWRGDTYNTYSTTDQIGSTSGKTIKANSISGSDLLDWTDLEALWLLFHAQRDPDTDLPIVLTHPTLIVMPAKLGSARRIVFATEVRSGDTTAASAVQTLALNPAKDYVAEIKFSELLKQIIVDSGVSAANADDWHFYGDPKKAFWYMENWGLTTMQAPVNNEAEFTRDIVFRAKATERGVPFVADPRYMTKAINA